MGILNNLFNKKDKKMAAATAFDLSVIKENLAKYTKFQWIKSERLGNVCELKDVVEDNGLVFVEFKDGSRINYQFLDDFIMKVTYDSELLDVTLDTMSTGITKSLAAGQQKSSAQVRPITPAKPENPIHSLIKKQKPNIVNVDIAVEMNIPSKELYKVVCDTFDHASADIVDYIVANMDIETIKTSIRNALEHYYETVNEQ